jgi:hypothetical protein
MKMDCRTPADLVKAVSIVAGLDTERQWTIEVTERRHKRNTAQNRLLWAIYSGIASATGHTAEEIHEACKRMFLPPQLVKLGTAELEVPASTTKLDVPEFSEYVERVQSWAANEFGVQA